MEEHLVPQSGLQMTLHLGQVEIGSRLLCQGGLGVVGEIDCKIEQGPRDLLAVDVDMRFGQVPTARTHQQHRGLIAEGIVLARRWIGEVEPAGPAVLQIHLAFDQIGPGRRSGVLEVRHEHTCAGVQGVDDHLAIDRPGDLDPSVREVGRDGAHPPVAGPHLGGLFKEVRPLSGVEPRLALLPAGQQFIAPHVELAVQLDQQVQDLGGQHLLATRRQGSDPLRRAVRPFHSATSHGSPPSGQA